MKVWKENYIEGKDSQITFLIWTRMNTNQFSQG